MFVRVERSVRCKKNVLYQLNMSEVRGEKDITQAKLEAMTEKIENSKKEVRVSEPAKEGRRVTCVSKLQLTKKCI